MEDLNPSGQTGEQPGAGTRVETLWTDSVLESPGARQFVKDSTTTADGVGGGERLATTVDDSTEMPGATARAAKSLEAGAGAIDVVPESGEQMPASSEEQTARPEMPQGAVGRSVRPPSPQGAPPAVEEEDEVEEIEREESRPQAVRILCKREDKVVVVEEEEDTSREVKRLWSTLSIAMKQIEVSIASAMSIFGVGE